ncbi:MAG TPA: hypothetical protein VLC09_13580 [Polyangiaceae bacterium]|nr:hypothetical protein [Polyangiaceae bacterium]
MSGEADFLEAKQAAAAGERLHGLFHLAAALAGSPNDEKWLALADDGGEENWSLDEFPEEQQRFFGLVALDARRRLQGTGIARAIAALVDVIRVQPRLPYAAWFNRPEVMDRIDKDSVSPIGPRLARFFIERVPFEENGVDAQNALGLEALLVRLLELAPGHPQLITYLRALLRETGRHDEALAFAVGQAERFPSWQTLALVGTSLREVERNQEALAWLERASREAPEVVSIHLDLGDLCRALQDDEAARTHYARALALQPDNEWARAALDELRRA